VLENSNTLNKLGEVQDDLLILLHTCSHRTNLPIRPNKAENPRHITVPFQNSPTTNGGEKKPTYHHPASLFRLTYSQSRMRVRQTPSARAVPGNGSLSTIHPHLHLGHECDIFSFTLPLEQLIIKLSGRRTQHRSFEIPSPPWVMILYHWAMSSAPRIALLSALILSQQGWLKEKRGGKGGKWKMGKIKRKFPSIQSKASRVRNFLHSHSYGELLRIFHEIPTPIPLASSSFHSVWDVCLLPAPNQLLPYNLSQASNTFSLVVGRINGEIVRSLGVGLGSLCAALASLMYASAPTHLRRLLEILNDSYDLHAFGHLWYQTAAWLVAQPAVTIFCPVCLC